MIAVCDIFKIKYKFFKNVVGHILIRIEYYKGLFTNLEKNYF